MRQLVHRRRRVAVVGPQRADERERVGQRAEAVDGGVSEIDGDRVATVTVLDLGDPAGDLVDRLVPADGRPGVTGAPHGELPAVGVDVDVLEGSRLRAEESRAEGVVAVAADRADLLTLQL